MFGLFGYWKIGIGIAVDFLPAAIYYTGVPLLKDIPLLGAVFEGQAKD
ncbi:hypothetical protein [Brucella pseudogrignonensis]